MKITYHLKPGANTLPDNLSTAEVPPEAESNSRMTSAWAHELRATENLHKVPNDKPGWYRWRAPIQALEKLLDSTYISEKYMTQLMPFLHRKKFNRDDYFCIYIGVAINESIRDRLNWHVNQHHTKSAMQSGFLSTLRKTISSLVSGNQYNEVATNGLIDHLLIEYYARDYPIKSDIAKSMIDKIGRDEMENNILPLNIMGNHHIMIQSFLADLKKARKQSSRHIARDEHHAIY